MTASDLAALAAGVVERASGREHIEAFFLHQRTFEARAFDGEIESVSSAEPRGAGVRVAVDDQVGFAYTSDFSSTALDELVARARDNAMHATADEAAGLPVVTDAADAVGGLLDEGQAAVTPERKIAFTLELEKATRTSDASVKVVEDAVYADAESEVALASSAGAVGSYRRSDAWCYSVAIVEQDGDPQTGFDFDLARGLASLDAETVARSGVERALRVVGGRKIPSARLPVVFDPYVTAQFVGVIGPALTGEAVQKGRSLFMGKLGEEIASSAVTLVDDGRLAGAPAAAPWDGEGVPTQRTQVIDSGVLSSFLYDTKSARREGRASTGNAGRGGFKSPPRCAPSNMAFEPTGDTADRLLAGSGRMLYVQDLHGVHAGANAVTGDFSVGATGVLYEDGEALHGVKEVTIAAPILTILKNIEVVADDRRWLPFEGAYGGATTLIAEMTVAGS